MICLCWTASSNELGPVNTNGIASVQEDRIKQLGQQFLERTREEMLLLHTHLPHARQGRADALLEIQRYVHRINGTGALLGFKAISEPMAQVERILRRADTPPGAADWALIQAQLSLVEAELARARTAQ